MASQRAASTTLLLRLAFVVSILFAGASVAQLPLLSSELAKSEQLGGVDNAVALYRREQARDFAQVEESEADTNAFGYTLLRRGDAAGAKRIFELNAEQHASSANTLGLECQWSRAA